jgi:signal peptidase
MAKKILNGILKAFSWIIVLAVVLFAVALVGVKLFGVQIYTVLSGSMEPVYHTGSVIYVVDVDPAELEVGDDITFKLSETTTATHRIIEIMTEEGNSSKLMFKTQGVANAVEDASPVSADQIIGTPVFTIPYLGYVAAYIQQPPGLYVGLSVGAGLLLLVVIIELLTDDKSAAEAKAESSEEKADGDNEESDDGGNDENEEEKNNNADKAKGENQ